MNETIPVGPKKEFSGLFPKWKRKSGILLGSKMSLKEEDRRLFGQMRFEGLKLRKMNSIKRGDIRERDEYERCWMSDMMRKRGRGSIKSWKRYEKRKEGMR